MEKDRSTHGARAGNCARLFESDVLEWFTHINPLSVAVIWSMVIVYLGNRTWQLRETLTGVSVAAAFLLGWFLWTFAEYTLHRFVLHYTPRSERGKHIAFYLHGIHHAEPMCKTRLVLPLPASIPLMALFYGIFLTAGSAIFGREVLINPFFAGFVFGYLFYDMLHYSIHHLLKNTQHLTELRVHHLRHHGENSELRFGISTRLWDRVFRTLPR